MLIDKNALPVVAMENMNEVHFEDVDILNSLSSLVDGYVKEPSDELFLKINAQYELWQEHTVKHFSGEEEMMLEKGFFAYPMHKSEHENALFVMGEVFKKWQAQKDISILQNYIQKDVPNWLVNHISTMDTVTALFLKTGLSPCQANVI